LELELNLSWYDLGLFLHGAPFGFIGIGSRTLPVKDWFAPEKYAGRGPNVVDILLSLFSAASSFSSFSASSYEILLKNAMTLCDSSGLIEALNKVVLAMLRSSR
jgi:hypothetical protein